MNKDDLKKIKAELNHRSMKFELRDGQVKSENNLYRFPVCSDAEVERWYGKEVLSHERGAMIVGERQKSMPLLFNHKRDAVVGIVESIEQDEHRTYATVRFAKTEEAEKIRSLVDDGILVNVSCGYQCYEIEESKDTRDLWIASSWELFEVSIVTVPADPSVGFNRSIGDEQMASKKSTVSAETENVSQERNEQQDRSLTVSEENIRSQTRASEMDRITQIYTMCRDFNIPDGERDEMVRSYRSIDEARGIILERMRSARPTPAASSSRSLNELALTEREKNQYSLIRALNACVSGNWSAAGFEREVSEALKKRNGFETTGFLVPTNLPFQLREDTTVPGYFTTPANQGGDLIATDLLGGSFIEALRNQAVVLKLGATLLSGLVGNVEIPKQTATGSAQWISETTAAAKSNSTFDKVPLKMKTISSRTYVSRNMLMQPSISMENFIRRDLSKNIALGIDAAALHGSGENGQPTGIANISGVGKVIGGTNGAALTFDHIIDMETQVADSNADVTNMAYVCNAATIGYLKKLKNKDDDYIWKSISEAVRNGVPGEINGYPVARTNQVRKGLTKGTATNCTELFFGNFADLIIGEWGFLEIKPNPYSEVAYGTGGLEVLALQSLDIAVRHKESFCVFSDAII
ncbi:phage major capsid protein [Turicimonas muris]|uniref:phage major capsid protein n=2 Tax=Turicimonas muris TaxID=1796652 RepID=UPI00248B66F4|nr:phage major capsid protein [Turicimonas muris]